MIRLNVKPYCNNCPMFEPAAAHDAELYYNGIKIIEHPKDVMVVFCKHNRQCGVIHNYLKQEVMKNGERDIR